MTIDQTMREEQDACSVTMTMRTGTRLARAMRMAAEGTTEKREERVRGQATDLGLMMERVVIRGPVESPRTESGGENGTHEQQVAEGAADEEQLIWSLTQR
jgi:hypothetical protein